MNDESNVEVIKSEVAPVLTNAAAMTVTTPAEYAIAGDFLKTVKAAQKKVTDFFAPMKQKAHEAHKAITSQETATLKPLFDAENALKRNMLTFYQAQERIRIEAQRKAQEEADRQAAAERARLEREAKRLKTPELKAERLEMAAAVVAPVVSVASAAPVIAGQSIRKTYKANVIDIDAVPREWMVVNLDALNAFARSTKGAVKVSGVEFVEVEILASGR